jgi:hypothetical protein
MKIHFLVELVIHGSPSKFNYKNMGHALFLNFANFVTKESKITSLKKYFPKFPAEESCLKKKRKKT